jgi:hypothetical protein
MRNHEALKWIFLPLHTQDHRTEGCKHHFRLHTRMSDDPPHQENVEQSRVDYWSLAKVDFRLSTGRIRSMQVITLSSP